MAVHQRTRQSEAQLLQPKVRKVVDLARGLYLLELEGLPETFRPKPGQFLHLRPTKEDYPLLRRPISLQSYRDGVATLLIREVGIGTELLHRARPGDCLDALGPLGTAYSPVRSGESVLMVGGGVGVAPLVAAALEAEPGALVDFCYGVATAGEIQSLDFLSGRENEIRIHVSTDDGSSGHHGFCTEVAERLLEERRYAKIFTCGPWVMMRKAFRLGSERKVPVEASLEVQMGCGLGACLGCVYETPDGDFIRSCIDGPVVDGYGVSWENH
ncbi:MAG: dihydroorotate dehydrogenase electron transfer subunit [Candidatus Omnitrophica bacterium]|nr:dihydroorotate dehydrogenase electron transfer subunit [Candidatus Omnitrophota bacterium]